MNIWTKSILTGIGVTILTYVLLYKKPADSYKGHYVIRVKENENAIAEGKRTVERVAERLEIRMTNYPEIEFEIKILNDQLIDLSILKMRYPDQMPRLITSKSNLEFREMYSLADLSDVFTKGDSLLGYIKPKSIIAKDTQSLDTGELATFTLGYTKPASDSTQPSILKRIHVEFPYENSDKKIISPPHIGTVFFRDTAFVDSIFRLKEFLSLLPPDLEFYYGPFLNNPRDDRPVDYRYIYALRGKPDKSLLLSNNSLKSVKAELDYNGIPSIFIEFNMIAAKKWQRLTTVNIGKPIAILIDNVVITAPTVNGTIEGGTSQINGGFTMEEAKNIAGRLMAGAIPATVTIAKEEYSKEKEAFLTGNLLLYLVIFLVASTITYLIFKLLDRNNLNMHNRIDFGNNPTP